MQSFQGMELFDRVGAVPYWMKRCYTCWMQRFGHAVVGVVYGIASKLPGGTTEASPQVHVICSVGTL